MAGKRRSGLLHTAMEEKKCFFYNEAGLVSRAENVGRSEFYTFPGYPSPLAITTTNFEYDGRVLISGEYDYTLVGKETPEYSSIIYFNWDSNEELRETYYENAPVKILWSSDGQGRISG